MARQCLMLLLLLLPGLLLPPGLVLAVCQCRPARATTAGHGPASQASCCADKPVPITATCCCSAADSNGAFGDEGDTDDGNSDDGNTDDGNTDDGLPQHRAKRCGCELRLPDTEDPAPATEWLPIAGPALLSHPVLPWLQPPQLLHRASLAVQVRPPPPDARRNLPLLL